MHLLPKSVEKRTVKIEILTNLSSSRFRIERPVDKFFKITVADFEKIKSYKFPEIKQISKQQRDEMLILTFKLGNMMFHDFSKGETFAHAYSLRKIEITDQIIEAIEENQKKYFC